MAKPRLAFDWAHQISLITPSSGILIINAVAASMDPKIKEIERDFFAYNVTTSEDTGKWMIPFDSAHQIGLSILSTGLLTLDEGV